MRVQAAKRDNPVWARELRIALDRRNPGRCRLRLRLGLGGCLQQHQRGVGLDKLLTHAGQLRGQAFDALLVQAQIGGQPGCFVAQVRHLVADLSVLVPRPVDCKPGFFDCRLGKAQVGIQLASALVVPGVCLGVAGCAGRYSVLS